MFCLAQVESELTQICTSILTLLDENLIPPATTGESKARAPCTRSRAGQRALRLQLLCRSSTSR